MAAERVKVRDPFSGAELDVPADSPQAKTFGASEEKKPAVKRAEKQSDK